MKAGLWMDLSCFSSGLCSERSNMVIHESVKRKVIAGVERGRG